MYETRSVTLKDMRERTEERYLKGLIDENKYKYFMTAYSDKPLEEIISELDKMGLYGEEYISEEELFRGAERIIRGEHDV